MRVEYRGVGKCFSGKVKHNSIWLHPAIILRCRISLIYTFTSKLWNELSKKKIDLTGCQAVPIALISISIRIIQQIENCMCVCSALRILQNGRKKWNLVDMVKCEDKEIGAFILGLCLCEECCLFASVFFILQTWVPLGYWRLADKAQPRWRQIIKMVLTILLYLKL